MVTENGQRLNKVQNICVIKMRYNASVALSTVIETVSKFLNDRLSTEA
jgi:hypothetical protein